MNVEDVRLRLSSIEKYKDDSESAHELEDDLWQEVLEAIAHHDCEDPASELARVALESQNIPFARWYA